MIVRLHHLAISVPDLNKAVDFYCGTLGFEEVTRDSWRDSPADDEMCGIIGVAGSYALLRLDDVWLEILEYASPKPKPLPSDRRVCDLGLTHLCLLVDDAQQEYERLCRAGMVFLSPPRPNGGEEGVSQGQCAYGRDPFGNFVEFLQLDAKPGH